MRRIALVLMMTACGRCHAPVPQSQAQFTEALRAQLASLAPNDQFAVKANGQTVEWVRAGSNQATVIASVNLYDDFRAGQSVREIAKRTIELANIGKVTGERLFVGLRERIAIERGNLFDLPERVQFKPVGSRLALALFEDRPEMMVLLKPRELEALDAGFDSLWPRAVEAVRALPPLEAKALNVKGVWVLEGDDYASALAVLGDAVEQLHLEGDPVVAVLGRYTVLVTGSQNETGLTALTEMLEHHMNEMSGRDYYPSVVIKHDGQWADYTVGTKYAELQLRGQAHDLEAQAQAFAEQLDGGSSGIATLRIVNKDGRLIRTAMLSEAMMLVPEVDVLRLPAEGYVKWSTFREVMGPACEKTELWPTRYRVTALPTAQQLALLKPSRTL